MTIPVQSVVNVSIAIGATFPSRAGFGTLNIVTNEIDVFDSTERIRSYSDIDGVADDWSASSEVYLAATSYFSQQPKPTSLKVSVRYNDATAGTVRSADCITDPAPFLGITDGSFYILIDGFGGDVTGMNFTTATTVDDIAAIIQVRLRAVDDSAFDDTLCYHDGCRFIIESPTTGITSFASSLLETPSGGTFIGPLLQMISGEAIVINGTAAETITESLDAISDIDSDWYGLMFTKEVRDTVVINGEDAVEAAAAWTEARVKVFFNTCNFIGVLFLASTDDIPSRLQAQSLRRTMTTYSSSPDEYPSASIAGRAFTVNFSEPNSTITLKFKQMPGITVEDLTVSQKNVLDSKNANALIDVGGSFFFAESFMANGTFFDETHGVDWLTNAIETNVFGYLLTRATKVPYTNKGIAAIEQQVIKALDEAVLNGLIAPGETIDGVFLGTGYKTTVIPVEDINQSDVEARFYPGLSFIVLGAGAIHRVQINGVFER